MKTEKELLEGQANTFGERAQKREAQRRWARRWSIIAILLSLFKIFFDLTFYGERRFDLGDVAIYLLISLLILYHIGLERISALEERLLSHYQKCKGKI